MIRELLIGSGQNRKKKVRFAEIKGEFENVTTLDLVGDVDVRHDLNVLPYPFEDDSFDEIHAYEVLEHCGRQGDWKFFFAQFTEFHRILKPNGYFCATVPMWDSPWAWGDPGHTRVITAGSLIFLDQREYVQVGETPITDYRPWYKADFERMSIMEEKDSFGFILKAIKGEERHTPQVVSDRR